MKKQQFSLNDTLMSFRDQFGETGFTMEDLVRGVLCIGSTGSSKTTSSGYKIASGCLKYGAGMLVLCVKDSEAKRFLNYCNETGRGMDVVHVKPYSQYRFDFLQYEGQPRYDGKTITSNIVNVLKAIINADKELQGRSNEAYWDNALDELLTNTVDLCLLSEGSVTVEMMYQIVSTAPKANEEPLSEAFDRQFISLMQAARLNVDSEVFNYVDHLSPAEKERIKDPVIFDRQIKRRFEKVRMLNRIDNFFFHSYRFLNPKTRGIVESSFSGLLFRLLQEPIFSLFCSGETNFTPEDVFQGKIIILDIPVLTYGKAGQDAQRLFKFIFELAMLRRDLDENNRPVVVWQDEGHLTLLEQDSNFLSTCREKRIANVMITQNISNFYQNMGGPNSEHRVSSLISLLSSKFFHANDHSQTNEMASKLIGDAYTVDYSYSDTVTGEFSNSRSQSYKREAMVPPEAFLDLKSGGIAHNGLAEAYVVFQGKSFHDGFHHRKVTFKQHFYKHSKT